MARSSAWSCCTRSPGTTGGPSSATGWSPAARGRGLARRAAALLADWAFATLPLDRLEITTTPDNTAALELAAALGFEREGVMRARNVERGRPVDLVMLARLRARG